ncbi:hypothetical protein ALC60_13039 [Trachymyrmex zeteki]|uniref:Uncharacterized protein n=2 Tax=Attini TaxID=143999 RepID=A0A151WJN8_9HYME|nr:hypothetical protein ALC60_13039 [Trachymyrmex zeteki]
MPAPRYHPLVLTPTSCSRTSARPVCSGRARYTPRARGPGEMCGNFMSSRPESELPPHFSDRYIRRSLQDYELLYPSFTNSIEESWMARTIRRGRRPQRLPKIVVRASRQLGFIGWYFAKDCEAYDSCACCSDKNRNLDVAGVLCEKFDLATLLFSSRGTVDEDFPAKRRRGDNWKRKERNSRREKRSDVLLRDLHLVATVRSLNPSVRGSDDIFFPSLEDAQEKLSGNICPAGLRLNDKIFRGTDTWQITSSLLNIELRSVLTLRSAPTAGIPREISPMEVVSIPPRTKLQIVLLTETNYFLSTNRGSFIPRYHVPGGAQGARDSKQD